MPEAKGMWEGLMDFSFRVYATPKMLRFLYALHLLVGLIAGVAWVVVAFQQAPVQGLLALLAALGGYFVWFLYCRVVIELLAAVFRMADAIALIESVYYVKLDVLSTVLARLMGLLEDQGFILLRLHDPQKFEGYLQNIQGWYPQTKKLGDALWSIPKQAA